MNTGKALLGALVGLAAGALIGVLFAPGKGCDIRKKLCGKEEGFENALKEKFDEFLDSISEKFEKVNGVVSDFINKAQSKLENEKKEDKKGLGGL